MRYMKQVQAPAQQTIMTRTFGGLNRLPDAADGEMRDMKNLSADLYPLLTQRRMRGITRMDPEGAEPVPLNGIHGRDQLCLIRGTEVWWAMRKLEGISVSAAEDMLPKKIVSMGAYVCIWPDKVYFNTANLSDCGSMERNWSYTSTAGVPVTLIMCRNDGRNYADADVVLSPTEPENPVSGMLWMDSSQDRHVLNQYSAMTESWEQVVTVYVKISAPGIGSGLKEYDTLSLSGLEAPQGAPEAIQTQVNDLNTSVIIYSRGEDYIIVAGLLDRATSLAEGVTIRGNMTVPDLDYVCEANNRLWGCKYGMENGQFVNEIRACKLGDFRNWQNFLGLASDSYTVSVGSDGPFTAAVSQKGYPVFFKEGCIHRISGLTPSTFQMSTTMCRGVQNGSWRSAVVVNEAILYKARSGIMLYDGSTPQSVGDKLGGTLYEDARAGSVGGRYYISMRDRTGEWSLFCLDTTRNLWHKEDNLHALGFGAVGDELYAIDEEHNTLVALYGSMGEREEEIEWMAEFALFGTSYNEKKYLGRFNIRMEMEIGAEVDLDIQYDSDGTWIHMGKRRGHTLRSFLLPIIPRRCDHLQVRLRGTGECRIHSISRVMMMGGDA